MNMLHIHANSISCNGLWQCKTCSWYKISQHICGWSDWLENGKVFNWNSIQVIAMYRDFHIIGRPITGQWYMCQMAFLLKAHSVRMEWLDHITELLAYQRLRALFVVNQVFTDGMRCASRLSGMTKTRMTMILHTFVMQDLMLRRRSASRTKCRMFSRVVSEAVYYRH